MHIEKREGKRGTKYRCHVRKINPATGVQVIKYKTFDRRAAATSWGKKIESDIEHGMYRDTKIVDDNRLSSMIATYMKEDLIPAEGAEPSKAGWKQEVDRLNQWLNHPFAARPISKVTPRDLLEYIKSRRRQHSKRRKKDAPPKPVSDATIRQELMMLSNVYQFAIDKVEGFENLINPVRKIPRDSMPSGSREIEVRIEPEKWTRLAERLGKRRNKMYVLISELGIETAMRQGELLRLQPDDVHINDGVGAKYVRAVNYERKGERVVENPRNVPLTNRAVEILEQVLEYRKKLKSDSQTIWGSISADGLSRAFTEDCKALGIVDNDGLAATYHATRHEGCSRMANAGIPMVQLMKITGHKTISQVQRYYNPNISDLGAIISVLNK